MSVSLDHYIEFVAVPFDGDEVVRTEIAYAISEITENIHKAIHDGAKVAIAFPGMDEEFVGRSVRVFGGREDLVRVADFTPLKRSAAGGLIGVANADGSITGKLDAASILPTPTAVGWASYARSREQEKMVPGWGRRRDRRRLRRIEEGKSTPKPALEGRQRVRSERPAPRRSFVQMRSTSTGRGFRLFVETKEIPRPVGGYFDNYGLARDGAAVPAF